MTNDLLGLGAEDTKSSVDPCLLSYSKLFSSFKVRKKKRMFITFSAAGSKRTAEHHDSADIFWFQQDRATALTVLEIRSIFETNVPKAADIFEGCNFFPRGYLKDTRLSIITSHLKRHEETSHWSYTLKCLENLR